MCSNSTWNFSSLSLSKNYWPLGRKPGKWVSYNFLCLMEIKYVLVTTWMFSHWTEAFIGRQVTATSWWILPVSEHHPANLKVKILRIEAEDIWWDSFPKVSRLDLLEVFHQTLNDYIILHMSSNICNLKSICTLYKMSESSASYLSL